MAVSVPSPVSGTSITQRILGLCLLVIALVIAVLLALTVRQFNASIQQQADALGDALITHTVQEVSAPLALSDTLALAAVLREIVNNPYVAHAVLYSVDNRTLAEAGQRPRSGRINSRYTRTLALEQVIAGQLHIDIDVKRLQQPLYGNLQGLALIGVLLLLAAVMLLSRIARSISQPLIDLQRWLVQPAGPAPHQQRSDEIGQLARSLEQCFHLPDEAPPADPAPIDEPASDPQDGADEPLPTAALEPADSLPEPGVPQDCAVLAIELVLGQGLYELADERHQQLQNHYEAALAEVARHYQGQLLQHSASHRLMIFRDDPANSLTHALCAAELLRAFAHALQMDVADTGMALNIQLGVALGEVLSDVSTDTLHQHPLLAEALQLCRHSCNLVLLSETAARHPHSACASIRSIARPAGASCVERLHAPWPEQLDDQLQGLMLLMLEMDDEAS